MSRPRRRRAPPEPHRRSNVHIGGTPHNLLAAAEDAGVGHAVILSIVGSELVPDSVYYRAKVLQEDILKADVARAVADVAVGAPLMGTREVAGPGVLPLDQLGAMTLAAHGDKRTVVVDNTAGLLALAPGNAVIAKDGAVIATTRYADWLRR